MQTSEVNNEVYITNIKKKKKEITFKDNKKIEKKRLRINIYKIDIYYLSVV